MDTKAVFVILCSPLLPHLNAETIVVDELAKLNSPSIRVGDSLVFEHKGLYGLYIFCSKIAFELCDFLQATPILDNNNDKNSYIFEPSRPGYYCFSYSNKTNVNLCMKARSWPPKSCNRSSGQHGESLAGSCSFSGVRRHVPFVAGTSMKDPCSPAATEPARSPVPSAGGIQFKTSNPAVPLPTGETDTSIIRPLPMSGCTVWKMAVKG